MGSIIKNKKGNALVIMLILVIVLWVVWWTIGVSNRECNKDSECGEDRYCGSDFGCHDYKIIEKTVVQNYDYVKPAIILSIAIIIATMIIAYAILKQKKLSPI